jgi:hypothetical protein
MRTWKIVAIAALLFSLTAVAEKQKGPASLKDFQPAGTTDKKHKHQQFDFTFDAAGTEYTCRSSEGSKLKAIDWPVNSDITYELDKDKGKVKNAKGKQVDCTIMRVEAIKSASATPQSN